MTDTLTLSQGFDAGDFIAPDILKTVDASVRASAADILEQSSLGGDLEQLFDIQAAAPIVSDAALYLGVPSMNPDEFMPYEPPKMPEIADFDFSRAWESATEEEPEEVDIKIPDADEFHAAEDPVKEDFIVEIPVADQAYADLRKVQIDTLQFDKAHQARKARVRAVVFTVIIAAVVVVLILYLLSQ